MVAELVGLDTFEIQELDEVSLGDSSACLAIDDGMALNSRPFTGSPLRNTYNFLLAHPNLAWAQPSEAGDPPPAAGGHGTGPHLTDMPEVSQRRNPTLTDALGGNANVRIEQAVLRSNKNVNPKVNTGMKQDGTTTAASANDF